MTLITYDKALELLRGAVEEKGEDYRVDACRIGYTGEDGVYVPSCIVGYALNALNPEQFREVKPDGFVLNPTWKLGHTLTYKAKTLWFYVQQKQDATEWNVDGGVHYKWGEALTWAIDQVEEEEALFGPLDDTVSYGEGDYTEDDDV